MWNGSQLAVKQSVGLDEFPPVNHYFYKYASELFSYFQQDKTV